MSRYSDNIAKGLCGMCGANGLETPSLCAECKEKCRLRALAKRAQKRTTGTCYGSGCIVVPESGTFCESCKAKQKVFKKAGTARKKDAGICQATGCHEPAKVDCTLCQACISKLSATSSKHYHRRKAEGSCHYCNEAPVVPGGPLCANHQLRVTEYRTEIKQAALKAYGGMKCTLCPETCWEILEIDHIDGGGNQHRKTLGKGKIKNGGGYNFYLWLKRKGYPAGYRVLCPTCNKKAYRNLLPVPTQTA